MTAPHGTSRAPIAVAVLCAALAACSKSSSSTPPSNALTIHYHRPAADYAGWAVAVSGGATPASASPSGTDGFGAVFTLEPSAAATVVAFSLTKGGTLDPAGALTVDVSASVREVWVFSGWARAIPRRPPAVPGPNQAAFYYVRPDGAYTGWGLHVWGQLVSGTAWSAPLAYAGTDPELGAGFLIDLTSGNLGNCTAGVICLIVHKGDTKDPGDDIKSWSLATVGNIAFETSGSTAITTYPAPPAAIADASAHLVTRDLLVWRDVPAAAATFELRSTPDGSLVDGGTDVTGGAVLALTPHAGALPGALAAKMPQFASPAWSLYDVDPAQAASIVEALKGQLVAVARAADGAFVKASRVQTSWALDDLYAYDGPLGVTFAGGAPTFLLWAPTARSVRLGVFDAAKAPVADVAMIPEPQGVWSYAGPAAWNGHYYRYALDVFHPATQRIEHVVVTDPYAVNLSTNGLFAQVVDLADPELAPTDWATFTKPALATPEDIVLYEAHVRDFSVSDATVPPARRGKYLAFADDTASDGRAHLATLASAGVTHVHLLPAFDLATVDEDPASRIDEDQPYALACATYYAMPLCGTAGVAGKTVAEVLASFAGDSENQQAVTSAMRGTDAFNWGYDPFHFGAPEGSYASTAEGTAKIVEFRRMVQGLAALGLRVVMDVVYNHTNAAGLGKYSVLDQIVPGYYHRLDLVTGAVQSSTCCANTASERRMMERILVDHTVRWARDYKIDGFRFDLMGHHMKSNLLAVQAALASLTPGSDGVDGAKIYLYGEGWDYGEVQNNQLGVNACQLNMGGTGIGTFNDRLRDAVRGGGPFDSQVMLRLHQGFATGLHTDPNEAALDAAATLAQLQTYLDWIKAGMAGNLRNFRLVAGDGAAKAASAISYGGQPAGYTRAPREAITYVSAHDNQTLWDISQYKLPTGRSMAIRVRDYDLALDTVLLGQGIPFFHMGDDVLRSKSMDGNSYDSGDWFNRVDWTGQGNNWRVGLPPRGDNGANWDVIRQIFADGSIAPAAADVAAASAHFREMLRVRKSSRLFRLSAEADVMKRVDFIPVDPAVAPGVIVMTLTDGTDASCGGALADVDPTRDAVVVILNADVNPHTLTVPGASGFTLHPVLAASTDVVVRAASASGTQFTVPARTTAVFEQLQGASQGTGLRCNTR
jgi:pullulanase-type alpha-1,6-glucosidase